MTINYEDMLKGYVQELHRQEKASGTVSAYETDVKDFINWLDIKILDKENLIKWKEKIVEKYKASTINRKIASINGFLRFIKHTDENGEILKLKTKKIQRQNTVDKQLTENDIKQLVEAAQKTKPLKYMALVIQVMATTGIRASELAYLTVKSAKKMSIEIKSSKGTSRIVVLQKDISKKLLHYCKEQNIDNGVIFKKNDKPLDRNVIYRAVKVLAKVAKLDLAKVFPHNIRHFFAIAYLRGDKKNQGDIFLLSDILGHKSLETTRQYLKPTRDELRKAIGKNIVFNRISSSTELQRKQAV